MSSLMMAHVFEITKPDDYILLKMQEYRLGLTFLCNTAIRSESGNDRRVADSS
jgi:hypothetical protein